MTQKESALSVRHCTRTIFFAFGNVFLSGVLTKPDRIAPGDETGWLDFIRNEGSLLKTTGTV